MRDEGQASTILMRNEDLDDWAVLSRKKGTLAVGAGKA
jgi:hypothetical protein